MTFSDKHEPGPNSLDFRIAVVPDEIDFAELVQLVEDARIAVTQGAKTDSATAAAIETLSRITADFTPRENMTVLNADVTRVREFVEVLRSRAQASVRAAAKAASAFEMSGND